MIIACPQCDARFVVPSTIFANGGRKVRCASCKHEWFQDAPLDTEDDFERATFDEELVSVSKSDDVQNDIEKKSIGFLSILKKDFVHGFKIITGTCAIILILFFAYQYFTPQLIYGEGLAFNNMVVENINGEMVLSGEIVNTLNEERGVPSVLVKNLLAEGHVGDSFVIKPDKEILNSGEVLLLSAPLLNLDPEVQNISITFSGKSDSSVIDFDEASNVNE